MSLVAARALPAYKYVRNLYERRSKTYLGIIGVRALRNEAQHRTGWAWCARASCVVGPEADSTSGVLRAARHRFPRIIINYYVVIAAEEQICSVLV